MRGSILSCFERVRDPLLAEGLPGGDLDGLRPEHGPHRHLDGAGVGGRHDADPVIGRHLQDRPRQVDGAAELGLAEGRAVRPAERGVGQGGGRPARALGAGAGGEMGHARALRGAAGHDGSILADGRSSAGRSSPEPRMRPNRPSGKRLSERRSSAPAPGRDSLSGAAEQSIKPEPLALMAVPCCVRGTPMSIHSAAISGGLVRSACGYWGVNGPRRASEPAPAAGAAAAASRSRWITTSTVR